MDWMVAWHDAQLSAQKRKHKNTLVGLMLLCDMIKDMTLKLGFQKPKLPHVTKILQNLSKHGWNGSLMLLINVM